MDPALPWAHCLTETTPLWESCKQPTRHSAEAALLRGPRGRRLRSPRLPPPSWQSPKDSVQLQPPPLSPPGSHQLKDAHCWERGGVPVTGSQNCVTSEREGPTAGPGRLTIKAGTVHLVSPTHYRTHGGRANPSHPRANLPALGPGPAAAVALLLLTVTLLGQEPGLLLAVP